VTSSTSFEPVGDGYSHRIRSSVRGFCARQRCIRIDFKGDRDQRQYKNDDQCSHGPACSGEMRHDQPKKPAKNGSFVAKTCKNPWLQNGPRWLKEERSDNRLALNRSQASAAENLSRARFRCRIQRGASNRNRSDRFIGQPRCFSARRSDQPAASIWLWDGGRRQRRHRIL
jgi:hypothetical protein